MSFSLNYGSFHLPEPLASLACVENRLDGLQKVCENAAPFCTKLGAMSVSKHLAEQLARRGRERKRSARLIARSEKRITKDLVIARRSSRFFHGFLMNREG